jgi:hypothetical protein
VENRNLVLFCLSVVLHLDIVRCKNQFDLTNVFSDFSLSAWKAENQITTSNMETSEIALLQEELGISEYLKDPCSRQAGNYFPHRNYWKDG